MAGSSQVVAQPVPPALFVETGRSGTSEGTPPQFGLKSVQHLLKRDFNGYCGDVLEKYGRENLTKRIETKLEEAIQLVESAKIQAALHLGPIFAETLNGLPHNTAKEKQVACRWANDVLRQVGLAVRCPNTGFPAVFITEASSPQGIGRIQLRAFLPDGDRRTTVSAFDFSQTALIPAPMRTGIVDRSIIGHRSR